MSAWVYIMASTKRGTLYTGVTTDVQNRVWEHQNDILPGFTAKYGVKTLVWFEQFPSVVLAIAEEKRVKKWRRDWKISRVEKSNPDWRDLSGDIYRN